MKCNQPYCDYPAGQCAELCAGDYLEQTLNHPIRRSREEAYHSLIAKAKKQQLAQEAERIHAQERQSAIREIIEKMKAYSITDRDLNSKRHQA